MHHAHMAESVTEGSAAADQVLAALQSAGLGRDQALAASNRPVDQQAFTLAANEVFSVSSLMARSARARRHSRAQHGPARRGASAARGPAAAGADAGR